jgi:hypothetical protein
MLLQIWASWVQRCNGIPKEMQRSKRSKYDINKCLLHCLYCHNSNHPCVIGAIIFGCVWHAASRAHVWSALIQMHVGSLRLDSWTLAVFATFFSESFVVCLHGRPPTYQPINPSICWSDDPIVYQCVFWSVSGFWTFSLMQRRLRNPSISQRLQTCYAAESGMSFDMNQLQCNCTCNWNKHM